MGILIFLFSESELGDNDVRIHLHHDHIFSFCPALLVLICLTAPFPPVAQKAMRWLEDACALFIALASCIRRLIAEAEAGR